MDLYYYSERDADLYCGQCADVATMHSRLAPLDTADTPQHCGDCGDILALELTPDGYRYVARQIVHNRSRVTDEWKSQFAGDDLDAAIVGAVLDAWSPPLTLDYVIVGQTQEEREVELERRVAATLADDLGMSHVTADYAAMLDSTLIEDDVLTVTLDGRDVLTYRIVESPWPGETRLALTGDSETRLRASMATRPVARALEQAQAPYVDDARKLFRAAAIWPADARRIERDGYDDTRTYKVEALGTMPPVDGCEECGAVRCPECAYYGS